MKHYLYGLTIHSIQGYIFQTNKLKEIAGASEIVEQICTTKFAKMLGKTPEDLKNDDNALRNAAGNVRYVFNDANACKEIVRNFPKEILEFAPGVLISQAVVEIDDKLNKNHFQKLEELLTAQRNTPFRPVDLGYLAVNRSRLTGLPSVERKDSNGENLINDRATKLKQRIIENNSISKTRNRVNLAFFGERIPEENIPIDIAKIVSSKDSDYSWLAVIHVDGNNMGIALKNLNSEPTALTDYAKISKDFSSIVDKSTKEAAQIAFNKVYPDFPIGFVPFRPIIVGGDDLIVVCRADLAINFTQAYLGAFEKRTQINFSDPKLSFKFLTKGLTACAGIAYVKVNYPFHYAAGLAETLCNHAKKIARTDPDKNGLTPSCLMFHKVQDSFVESYQDIIERELTAHTSKCRFDFGPYFTSDTKGDQSINVLFDKVNCFKGKEGNAIKSSLRQWLTDLHYNKSIAVQRMNRLLSVANVKRMKSLNIYTPDDLLEWKTPVYDWLTILSINQNNDNDGND